MTNARKQSAFTILEMIVVLIISSTIVSLALFNSKNYANQALNGANSTMGFLKTVRAKALANTQAYTIIPSSTGRLTTRFGSTCSAATQTNDSTLTLDLPAGAVFTSTSWTLCYSTRGFANTSLNISVMDASSTRSVQVVLGGGVRLL
jgi:prepilin-type N-terminal cleavage/methylation domain-containing protein